MKKENLMVRKQYTMENTFSGGANIVIKVPKSKYEQTVSFYKDILKLEVEGKTINHPTVSRTHEVRFGHNAMWLDCVDNYTHGGAWLELRTTNVGLAAAYLASKGVHTCDELEKIPEKHALDHGSCRHGVHIESTVTT